MTESPLSISAAKFRQWWLKLGEMEADRRASSLQNGQHEASQFLMTLSRVGIGNGAMEYVITSTAENPKEGTSEYRLRSDFDWEDGEIVVESLDWSDFTGSEGLIPSLERVTGIREGDDPATPQENASPLLRRQQPPRPSHSRRHRR
jgi:hypothetical protein